MKKTILILIAIATIICSCNKTEQTLKKIYGKYEISQYTVNGIDSLSLFNDSLNNKLYFFYDNSSDPCYVLKIEGYNSSGIFKVLTCCWRLINNNNIIQVYKTAGSIGTGPFGFNRTPEFEILNLTRKELKMKTVYNNKEYLVLLKK